MANSQINKSQINRIDYSNIDESDLCLDLDDDDDLDTAAPARLSNNSHLTSHKTDNNNNKNLEIKNQNVIVNDDGDGDDDQLLFKIPDPVPQSEKLKSFSKANQTNSRSNLDLDSTQLIGGFEQHEDSLNDLFGADDCDNNDENDEDFLIRTQPIFSSTQSISMPPPPKTNNTQNESIKIIEKNKVSPVNQTNLDNSVIITTQSVSDLINKNNSDQVKSFNPNSSFLNQDLCDKSVWEFSQDDLSVKFRNAGLDSNLLKKFTIDYYYKKFFDYNLLRISDTGLRKIPILSVAIKEINRNDRNSNATVVLTDGIDEIKGTISKQITSNNWDQMSIGSVLFLQNVCLLRVDFVKNGYHLNIGKSNLVCIYYKTESDKISKLNYNELNSSNIKNYIDNFEKTYIYIDASLIKLNTTCASNKSSLNSSTASNTSSNNASINNNTSNKNYNHRSAPYHIPSHLNNNSKNQTTNQNNSNQTKKIPAANENRSFKFGTGSVNKNTCSNNNQTSQQARNLNSNSLNHVQSSQKEISDEVFSQLIFGIEDEFLKDDDE